MVCCKSAKDNVMECMWCEARLHATCAKISEELCIFIGNTTNHVVFLCSPCYQTLPIAFKYYDGFSNIDSRITNIEKLFNEKQSAGSQISTDTQQFANQHKEISNRISDLTSRTSFF